jgi:hypothetical protein
VDTCLLSDSLLVVDEDAGTQFVLDGGHQCGPQGPEVCLADAGLSASCAAAMKAQLDWAIGCPSCGTPGFVDCGQICCCESLQCYNRYCCLATNGPDDTCVSDTQCCTFKCCPPSANGRNYCALPDGSCVP